METTAAPTWVNPRVWRILEETRQTFMSEGGRIDKPLDYAARCAELEAYQFVGIGSAYVSYSPGNMTAYDMLLHDLVEAQIKYIVHLRSAPLSDDELDRVDEAGKTLRQRIEAKVRASEDGLTGAAGRWGGPLLIAMPIRGASVACALMDYYHPSFCQEHLSMRTPDAIVVAEFLSLFGAAVQNIRKERASA